MIDSYSFNYIDTDSGEVHVFEVWHLCGFFTDTIPGLYLLTVNAAWTSLSGSPFTSAEDFTVRQTNGKKIKRATVLQAVKTEGNCVERRGKPLHFCLVKDACASHSVYRCRRNHQIIKVQLWAAKNFKEPDGIVLYSVYLI